MNKRYIIGFFIAVFIIVVIAGGGWLLGYLNNQPKAEGEDNIEAALSKEAEELLENLTIAPEEFLELHPELMELVLTSDGIYRGETAPKMAAERLWSFSVGMPLFKDAREYLATKNNGSSLAELLKPEAFMKIFAKKVLTDPILGYQLADFFSRLKIEPFGKTIAELKGNEFIKEFAQEFEKKGVMEFLSFNPTTKTHKVTASYQEIAPGLLARFWAFKATTIETRPTRGRYISNADLVGVKDVRLLFTEEEKYQENLESLVLELQMKGGAKVAEFGVNIFDSSIVIFGEKKIVGQKPAPNPTLTTDPIYPDTPIDKEYPDTPIDKEYPDTPIDKEYPDTPIDKEYPDTPIDKEYPDTPIDKDKEEKKQDPILKKDYKEDPAEKNNAEVSGGKKEEPGPGPKTEPGSFDPVENEGLKDDPELQKQGVNPEEAVEQIDSNPIDSTPTQIIPLTEQEKQEIGENNGDWEE